MNFPAEQNYFFWRLSDNKSAWLFGLFLSILADHSNAIAGIVSILPQISNSFLVLSFVPSVPPMKSITVTFKSNNLSSLAISRSLFIFPFPLFLICAPLKYSSALVDLFISLSYYLTLCQFIPLVLNGNIH